MTGTQCSFRWQNHTQSLISSFEDLLKTQLLTDMIIVLEEGQQILCHKVVLAAASSSFHRILMKNPESSAIVLPDITYKQMKALLEYMYSGKVQVFESELENLLQIAEKLEIKGLTPSTRDENEKDKIEMTSPPPTVNSSTVNTRDSPPHSTVEAYYKSLFENRNFPNYLPPNFPLIPTFPMASLPTFNTFNGANDTGGVVNLNKKYDQENRSSPILRTVLHQGGQEVNSFSQEVSVRSRSNSSADDSERHSSVDGSQGEPSFYPKNKNEATERNQMQCQSSVGKTPSGKSQKMDWKRYKQYSSDDLAAAINAVKYEKMSALKASKIFSVPSRTLYDKIKRLKIAKSRTIKRESSKVNGNSDSACFPYGIGGNVDGNIYNRKFYFDNENDPMDNGHNSTSDEGSPLSSSQNHLIGDWQKPVCEPAEDVTDSILSQQPPPPPLQQPPCREDCEIPQDLSMPNRRLSSVIETKAEPGDNFSLA